MFNRYANKHIDDNYRKLKDIVLWQLGYYNDAALPPAPPEGFSYPNPRVDIDVEKPQVTWINHCSFMLQWENLHILTDPIWSDRCSPIPFLGPKRQHPVPIAIEDLPRIDIVLISHNHYDHLDERTVKALHRKNPHIRWVVAQGLKKWFVKRGITHVQELKWWDKALVGPFEITAVPCQHFSGRGIFDKDETLWVGYVMESENKRFYFVGDTGYNPYDFKSIGKAFSYMDLSLIPVGTYVPHLFMDPVHICPVKATAIHQEVESKLSVGMHWKTFRLSGEGADQPPYDLYLSMKEVGLDPLNFRMLEIGQTINW
ncbi:MAG: MBL fold metallo-hydrolase [Simkaniaceae bacterium]|nr:MBL fold metallo-hydrolase [Simkaniaceae bacterium]